MSAVSAVGGTALGAGIGYAVGGRTGALVGGVLGAIGGYNVDPLADAVVERRIVRQPVRFTARSGGGAADTGRPAAVVGGARDLADMQRARLRAIGYDPNAVIVASVNGDPWGSFRVKRSEAWEREGLSLVDGAAEDAIRAVGAGLTLGISEVVIRVVGASRRDALAKSIQADPTLLVWSPDYPPATWPYQGGIQVDTGVPFGDAERALQIQLYGPTEADVQRAVERRSYVAQLDGRKVVASLDALSGLSGRWGLHG